MVGDDEASGSESELQTRCFVQSMEVEREQKSHPSSLEHC